MSLIRIHNFLTEELRVLEAFFIKQEHLIADFVKNIDKHVEVYEVQYRQQRFAGDEEGEAYIDEVEHIAGITEDQYDIRKLFAETMPTYQRPAFLLTLWGVFESELDKMCVLVCSTFDDEYSIPDNKKKLPTYQHLLNELEKRGVPLQQTVEYSSSLEILGNEVRHVRNAWAHNAGRDVKERVPADAYGIIRTEPVVTIAPEYIHKVINLMSIVAKDINAYSYPILLSAAKK